MRCHCAGFGKRLRFTFEATLGLFAAGLVLDALYLAVIARRPDWYALGAMLIVIPLTPLLLSPFFRHGRSIDEPPGEFTTGQLLRNKQARVAARTRGNLTGAPSRPDVTAEQRTAPFSYDSEH